MGKIILNNVDYSAPVTSGVSGVKGNAENNYRTGNVNLTPENIGALSLNGGTMNNDTTIFMNGTDTMIDITAANSNTQISYNIISISGKNSNQESVRTSIYSDKIVANKITPITSHDIENVTICYDTINLLNEQPSITKSNTNIQPHIITIQYDDIESRYYKKTTIGNYYATFQNQQEDDNIFDQITISSKLNNGCGIEAYDKIDNKKCSVRFCYGNIFCEPYDKLDISLTENTDIARSYIFDKTGLWSISDNVDLGKSSFHWRNIYATNGTIQTSDRTKKMNINSLKTQKAQSFINGLNPVSYKMIDGTSGRTHYGFIAQDIEELMNTLNMDSKDFAGFIKSPKKVVKYEDENGKKLKQPIEEIIEGEYDYSLRYDEFIAPLIKVVQEQQKAIENQQQQITQLKNALENANL